MWIVTLSDHIQSQIEAIDAAVERERARRQASHDAHYVQAHKAASEQQTRFDAEHESATLAALVQQELEDGAYEDAQRAAAERDREIDSVREQAARAWSERQFRRALALRIRVLFMRRAAKPRRRTVPPPRRQTARDPVLKVAKARPSPQQQNDLRRLRDSREGEQRLPKFLGRLLDDAWVLVQGYRNSQGEVDCILVGPPGVCAIELKYLNGVVYAEADHSWFRDKYDNYGNLVESGEPIRDRGDRSPSQQVRGVAAELDRFLQRRMPDRERGVRTAVILTHELSEIGKMNAGVDVVRTLSELEPQELLPGPGAELTNEEVSELVELIARDHRFHENRRSEGRRRRR